MWRYRAASTNEFVADIYGHGKSGVFAYDDGDFIVIVLLVAAEPPNMVGTGDSPCLWALCVLFDRSRGRIMWRWEYTGYRPCLPYSAALPPIIALLTHLQRNTRF